MATFRVEPIGDVLAIGTVEPHAARVWVRTAKPGRYALRVWPEGAAEGSARERAVEIPPDDPADHTRSVRLPGEADGSAERLSAGTPHRVRLVRAEDGATLAEGRFTTAPAGPRDAPERFAFALASCNQPFRADGSVDPEAEAMLRAMRTALARHGARFVLTVGDQLYTDYPPSLSLFEDEHFARVAPPGRKRLLDCTTDEVRRLVQERYRRWWNVPGWLALHAELPCYPILDDHEIVDNWGSAVAHAQDPWRSVGRGARLAYLDYQASRVLASRTLPASFDYGVSFGPLALYVLDLRSNRTAAEGGRLYGMAQREALETFLRANDDKEVLGLVLSVPLVHLPRWAARLVSRSRTSGEDFSDRWSSGSHVRDRDRLLARLHAHQRANPQQRVVLLSGDIHIACVHALRWDDLPTAFHQLVSSGLTHGVGRLVAWLSKASIVANRRIATMDGRVSADVRRLRGVQGDMHNPYTRRNFGLVEVERPSPDARVRLRFLIYGHRGDEPRCVFRSAWL